MLTFTESGEMITSWEKVEMFTNQTKYCNKLRCPRKDIWLEWFEDGAVMLPVTNFSKNIVGKLAGKYCELWELVEKEY